MTSYMNYDEKQQKSILRVVEQDLLAIVAIDIATEDFEVVYSDGAYRDYENRFQGKDFFSAWMTTGMSMICEEDRDRLAEEISKEYLLCQLSDRQFFQTVGRFFVRDEPSYCRIQVTRDLLEEGTLVMSIRNIDHELRLRQESERNIQELEERLSLMQAKKFTNQMHPHFVYSALSSIREIVLMDPEHGADLLYDFTTHIRASIRNMVNDKMILFSEELENIKAYVNIEKIRCGERLAVEYDIEAEDFMILPLCIQPLVENAIRHGIYEKGSRGGTVSIRTRNTDEAWEIEVADDGIGFDPAVVRAEVEDGRRDSAALFNIIYRLENIVHAKVYIDSASGKGTTVSISLPKAPSDGK